MKGYQKTIKNKIQYPKDNINKDAKSLIKYLFTVVAIKR